MVDIAPTTSTAIVQQQRRVRNSMRRQRNIRRDDISDMTRNLLALRDIVLQISADICRYLRRYLATPADIGPSEDIQCRNQYSTLMSFASLFFFCEKMKKIELKYLLSCSKNCSQLS
jgi:hypothetical protein